MSETVKKTGLELMREPFAPALISKLCRSTRKDNPKGSCKVCGGYHGQPSIALDYVGHAALTDRLLECDNSWNWEPVAMGSDGYPLIDKDGGMWIKLTVCGVTRMGYGDAAGKTGGDATKERIGDALRNAAMRFGAALDLWHKGELHAPVEETPPPKQKAPVAPPVTPRPDGLITGDQNKLLRTMLTKNGADAAAFKTHFKIASSLELRADQMNEAVKWIEENKVPS